MPRSRAKDHDSLSTTPIVIIVTADRLLCRYAFVGAPTIPILLWLWGYISTNNVQI